MVKTPVLGLNKRIPEKLRNTVERPFITEVESGRKRV
jgi:hypothetical protein